MAKKAKASTRRKHNQVGQTVVNFYNCGTVNIDARQNNSRAFKHENNGCTINTSDYAEAESEQRDILREVWGKFQKAMKRADRREELTCIAQIAESEWEKMMTAKEASKKNK